MLIFALAVGGGLNSEGVEQRGYFFEHNIDFLFSIAKIKAKSFDLGSLKGTVCTEEIRLKMVRLDSLGGN